MATSDGWVTKQEHSLRKLNVIDRHGYLRWRPVEVDYAAAQAHWFWHPDDDSSLKTLPEIDFYLRAECRARWATYAGPGPGPPRAVARCRCRAPKGIGSRPSPALWEQPRGATYAAS